MFFISASVMRRLHERLLIFSGLKHKKLGVCEWLLMVFVLALVLLFFPLSIWFCVKVRTKPLILQRSDMSLEDRLTALC